MLAGLAVVMQCLLMGVAVVLGKNRADMAE
jgi:hypothetical protein